MDSDPEIDPIDFNENSLDDLVETIYEQFQAFYQRKALQITDALMPQIQDVYEKQPEKYKRILIPFSDGRSQPLAITAEIVQAVRTKGKSIITDIEKAVTLAIIDENWKEHLRSMDELKESSQSASFEQKDPLVVYKMEAYNLFEELIYKINDDTVSYLSKGSLVLSDGRSLEQAREQKRSNTRLRTNANERTQTQEAARAAAEGVSRPSKPQTIVRTEEKVGRNDPCPCGSGKKYKKCHGR